MRFLDVLIFETYLFSRYFHKSLTAISEVIYQVYFRNSTYYRASMVLRIKKENAFTFFNDAFKIFFIIVIEIIQFFFLTFNNAQTVPDFKKRGWNGKKYLRQLWIISMIKKYGLSWFYNLHSLHDCIVNHSLLCTIVFWTCRNLFKMSVKMSDTASWELNIVFIPLSLHRYIDSERFRDKIF